MVDSSSSETPLGFWEPVQCPLPTHRPGPVIVDPPWMPLKAAQWELTKMSSSHSTGGARPLSKHPRVGSLSEPTSLSATVPRSEASSLLFLLCCFLWGLSKAPTSYEFLKAWWKANKRRKKLLGEKCMGMSVEMSRPAFPKTFPVPVR